MFEKGSTLKKIGTNAFCGCERLASVTLPAGLEEIGLYAFYQSDISSVTFPSSLRTVAQGSFANCKHLRVVKFNEGLEVLGTDECQQNGAMHCGVFQGSAVENVQLPQTLKSIEYRAFMDCEQL